MARKTSPEEFGRGDAGFGELIGRETLAALERFAAEQASRKAGGGTQEGAASRRPEVHVHFHLSGGAQPSDLAAHRAQIAAELARLLFAGRRNL